VLAGVAGGEAGAIGGDLEEHLTRIAKVG